MIHLFMQIALVVLVVAAIAWDLRERRIPNAITVLGCALALALRAFLGLDALGAGLLGLGAGFLVGLPIFAMGGMGGGDVKLLAAIGAFLGPGDLVPALIAMALIGGLMAILWALKDGRLVSILADTGRLVYALFGKLVSTVVPSLSMYFAPMPRRTIESPGALTIPYALPIGAGALFAWFTASGLALGL